MTQNKVKYCAGCYKTLPFSSFNVSRKSPNGLRRLCKDCTYTENKVTSQLIRLEVLIHYSGDPPKCQCCGENKLEFLSIDHIDGDGHLHRKEDPSSGKLDRWLKRNNFPEGFRILCMNCNWARGIYGYCPHIDGSKLINKLPENYELRKYKRWSAKITLENVLKIRERISNGEDKKSLALEYGISIPSINHIIARRRWKNI